MTEPSVAARVYHVVGAMAPKTDIAFTDESRLIEDLGFDSLRLMELTVVLERTFGLPGYRPEQLAGVLRVGQVVALIRDTLDAGRR
ncbi:acyl carrier protein [Nocardia sp. X0981]